MFQRILFIICSLSLLGAMGFFPACSSKPKGPKVYRIARDVTWYPLNFMGKENNMLGFVDDLILAVGKEQKLNIELIFTTANTLTNGVNAGLYDGAVTSLTPTSHSRIDFLFSDPLFLLGPVLVVHKNSTISEIQQLEEKVIGIQRGSAAAFDTVRFPSVTITPYDNNMLALEDLSRKQIDGVLMEAVPAFVYIQSFYKNSLKIATQPLTELGLRIITNKDREHKQFLEEFNKGLQAVKENGTYDRLILKWGLYNSERVGEKLDIKLDQ